MKQRISSFSFLLLCIAVVLTGCGIHPISKDRIILDFEKHKDAFEYVAEYIREFDLTQYKEEANTDLPLFVDFASSDFESGNYSIMVSAGWAPTVYDKIVEVDGEIVQAVSEIFDLNYAYIGQIAVSEGEPLVIYFRVDDVKKPEKDKPHGIAYTSDNLPPSIDNGDRKVVYTEQISDHWFYYEKNALNDKTN